MNYYESYYESMADYLNYYMGIDSYDAFLKYYGVSEELTMDNAKLSALEDVLLLSVARSESIALTDTEYTEGLEKYVQEWGYESSAKLLEDRGEIFIRTTLIKDKAMEYLLKKSEITSDYDDYKHLLEETDESEG